MNGIVVLDTSVIVKWFLQDEDLAEKALQWRDSYLAGELTLFALTLLAYELANVLHFKAGLTTTHAQIALQSLYDMSLLWLSPDASQMQRTIELARTHKLTVYDAAFVAVAEQEGALFVTADRRLAQQLAEVPFVRSLDSASS